MSGYDRHQYKERIAQVWYLSDDASCTKGRAKSAKASLARPRFRGLDNLTSRRRGMVG